MDMLGCMQIMRLDSKRRRPLVFVRPGCLAGLGTYTASRPSMNTSSTTGPIGSRAELNRKFLAMNRSVSVCLRTQNYPPGVIMIMHGNAKVYN